ncbi:MULTISPECIES: hypothetical protein [Nitrincola]|nr:MULTISPECIES: hypothetical protein [Nitrincola]
MTKIIFIMLLSFVIQINYAMLAAHARTVLLQASIAYNPVTPE